MQSPPTSQNEAQRLAHLKEYDILDSLPEQDFDDIAELASHICEVPVSLITFIDKSRQWFKSAVGTDINETKREYAFCAHAINTPEREFIVTDLRADIRFSDNPLVAGDPHIVFTPACRW